MTPQEIKRKSKKWSAGILGLYLDWRLKRKKKRRPIDVALIDFLMPRVLVNPKSLPFKKDDLRSYIKHTTETVYWHGTGRFQYDKNGAVIDVLELILRAGVMQPFVDMFDFKHGKMKSISVARQRMYGRIYADMHQYKGVDLSTRYGSPSFWTYYFIVAVNLHATKELGLWSPKIRREKHIQWRQQAKETWTIKVTRNQDPDTKAGNFFTNGSDIKGNFPILIGIQKSSYKIRKTADYIARYESRIGESIDVKYFTHLEVPATKVQEMRALLEKYGYSDIPVYAIERVEGLCATKRFSELVR